MISVCMCVCVSMCVCIFIEKVVHWKTNNRVECQSVIICVCIFIPLCNFPLEKYVYVHFFLKQYTSYVKTTDVGLPLLSFYFCLYIHGSCITCTKIIFYCTAKASLTPGVRLKYVCNISVRYCCCCCSSRNKIKKKTFHF